LASSGDSLCSGTGTRRGVTMTEAATAAIAGLAVGKLIA